MMERMEDLAPDNTGESTVRLISCPTCDSTVAMVALSADAGIVAPFRFVAVGTKLAPAFVVIPNPHDRTRGHVTKVWPGEYEYDLTWAQFDAVLEGQLASHSCPVRQANN